MKRVHRLATVLLAAAAGACAAPPARQQVPAAKIASEVYAALDAGQRVRVIVALREPTAVATATAERRAAVDGVQRSVLSELTPEEFHLTDRWELLSAFAGDVNRAGLARLEAHPDVLRVHPDVTFYPTLAESMALIKGRDTHDAGVTGSGVLVAVLDTGIDNSHPDLRDRLVDEKCFCSDSAGVGCCPNGATTQTGSGSARDHDGHGTNVTGIIVSQGRVAPVGVAPGASVIAYKVLGPGGGSFTAITTAMEDVLKNSSIKVVNMSLGGGRSSTVCDSSFPTMAAAANSLRSRGTSVFVASGNEGFPDSVAAPACLNAVVAVGAVYDDNVGGISFSNCSDGSTRADQVTCFTNSSSLVELFAPGGEITSSGLRGGTSSQFGTSQATPHIAGVAALMLQVKGGLSTTSITKIIQDTGVTVRDAKNGLEFKRVDARAAVSAAR